MNELFRFLLSLCAAATMTVSIARAETTGATLLSWCGVADQGLLLCHGYLRGISEATTEPDRYRARQKHPRRS